MVKLDEGSFQMGATGPECWESDGEGPIRQIQLRPYWIARCCVSNDEFSEFVGETGYKTEAERYGWSFVFYDQVPKAHRKRIQIETVMGLSWWAKVDGANWKKPGGAGTNVRKSGDHPVIHVSWNDAVAYCRWGGYRLPTEAEWENAARGGLEGKRYAWGDELTPGGKHHCNIWQGTFPSKNTAEDGYAGLAPVRSFPKNGYGLYNVAGNVWEWNSDWFCPRHHVHGSRENPSGPDTGKQKVIRGGSFLCHESYCNRYRVAARTGNTPDSSTCHTGFRVAADVEDSESEGIH